MVYIWPGRLSTLNNMCSMIMVVAIAASGKPNLPKQPSKVTHFSGKSLLSGTELQQGGPKH